MIPFNKNILPEIKDTYIVGGSIRDLLLDRSPTDYDIAVTGNPEKFAEKMAEKLKGHVVQLGKPDQTMIRVVSNHGIFDITPLGGTSVEDNLRKRDFTINALAYKVDSGEIIDCLGGLQDLADKKIRMVSGEVFREDPLRLLRAYRIGACLHFTIEPRTESAIRADSERIKRSAGERIHAEFFKMLETSLSYVYLSQMDDSGLLTAIFPDLVPLKGCVQNRHHAFDGFEHTMRAYDHLETLLNNLEKALPDSCVAVQESMAQNGAALIKCAMLLHDIGKPLAKRIEANGEIHFYGHALKSSELAREITRKLKFSNHEKMFIDFIIRNHIKPLALYIAHKKKTLTPRGLIRFYKKCADNTPALLLHAMADMKAKQNRNDQRNKNFTVFAKKMIHDFFNCYKPARTEPLLITGHDLIKIFGLTPSPLFKKILNFVDESKLTHIIKDRSEALSLVENYLKRQT